MSNCCCEQGLLQDIGPIIEGLRSENDRMVATCVLMTLLKYFNDNSSDFIKSVTINGNIITFTKNDGTTIDIQLPIDEYVNGAEISGNNLVLKRQVGNDIIVDLSGISPDIDTSRFFASCSLSGNTILFKNLDGETLGSINLKDGMLTNVQLSNNNLVFTWNTDAGISQKTISLSGLVTSDTYIDDGSLEYDQVNTSHYIQLDYNDDRTPIKINLNDFKDNIIQSFPFIPGYYWSSGKPGSNGKLPLGVVPEYIGTDLTTTVPYDFGKHRYIVYSNNGITYKLILQFKEPPVNKYILLSTYVGSQALRDQVSQPESFLFLSFMNKVQNKHGDNFFLHKLGVTDLNIRHECEDITISNGSLVFTDATSQQSHGGPILNDNNYRDFVKSMFLKTGLFSVNGNTYGQLDGHNYKLRVFYTSFVDLNTQFPSSQNFELFEYTNSEASVASDPNGDETIKEVILEKSKFCNFIETTNRIGIANSLTIPSTAVRANRFYTIDKEAIDVDSNTGDINIKLIIQKGSNYYFVTGFQVLDVNTGKSVSFSGTNEADNCFMYTKINSDYKPASITKETEFRNVPNFRDYFTTTQFKMYKKTYLQDTITHPETIVWEEVTNGEVDFSDLVPGWDLSSQSFVSCNVDNWVKSVTSGNDPSVVTYEPDREKIDFIWSVLIGKLVSSSYRSDYDDTYTINSDYIDTLGWNNKSKHYVLAASGSLKVDICLHIEEQPFNTTTNQQDSQCTVVFDIVSKTSRISGHASLVMGSYDYLLKNGNYYNFSNGVNLKPSYKQFNYVYPKITVNHMEAVAYKHSSATDTYNIVF